MIRPLSSEFSILLSDVKSQLAGRMATSHGPRVGADCGGAGRGAGRVAISIHGPRVGADHRCPDPAGNQLISIHGPRVGADRTGQWCSGTASNFNPRPPCGGRPGPCSSGFPAIPISIRGPRVGADLFIMKGVNNRWDFNPRPPCGGRLPRRGLRVTIADFNPRPPCGGRLSGMPK